MNNMFSTVLVAFVLGIIVSLILAAPVMWLWNAALLPAAPFLKEIGFFQAWAIMILLNILFKGVEVKMNS